MLIWAVLKEFCHAGNKFRMKSSEPVIALKQLLNLLNYVVKNPGSPAHLSFFPDLQGSSFRNFSKWKSPRFMMELLKYWV